MTIQSWTTIINSGIPMPNITKNVHQNLILYPAAWKVSYYNKAGDTLLHTEYVEDGEDAVWGASSAWSDTPEGAEVSGILNDISANIDVYRVTDVAEVILNTPLFISLLRSSSTVSETWTSQIDGYVLVINEETINEAGSGHSTIATTTSTGTILNSTTVYNTFVSQSPYTRDSTLTLSVIRVSIGDTVTMTNSSRGSHDSKTHLIFESNDISVLTNQLFDTVQDNRRDQEKIFTAQDTGRYLVMSQQVSTSGRGVATSVSVPSASLIDEFSSQTETNNNCIDLVLCSLNANDSVTMTTTSATNYVSKIYSVWHL